MNIADMHTVIMTKFNFLAKTITAHDNPHSWDY